MCKHLTNRVHVAKPPHRLPLRARAISLFSLSLSLNQNPNQPTHPQNPTSPPRGGRRRRGGGRAGGGAMVVSFRVSRRGRRFYPPPPPPPPAAAATAADRAAAPAEGSPLPPPLPWDVSALGYLFLSIVVCLKKRAIAIVWIELVCASVRYCRFRFDSCSSAPLHDRMYMIETELVLMI